ncbi:hypothetical protein D7Z96_06165 [Pseudarthrobacter phenanthrenivorans]|uniref:Uncharacterized protein n=1 Tax=Pseudarthrobacter phenanthrenivorans TaxID=361575 RepID=A0A3B0G079_PSEPS|nr:hypothetical protein [Pseudarthrobacter phenanthrenivorans]RKO25389.1 hypothetical protein D7Z96_06165 [Pseudarthrobacter phenanthrenivorans]
MDQNEAPVLEALAEHRKLGRYGFTPIWALPGADICVVSAHKMGLGFEQGSMFHLQGNLVDPVRLNQCGHVLPLPGTRTAPCAE